ncbi:MAG: hypothetical protein NC924_02355 [Candidatus Omnitrophica bacterium]|nr:hypothetical protein [Candidatus Omnitrophota bacterium]
MSTFAKLCGLYFAAAGFFLLSSISLLRGGDLLFSLTRGLIALIVCWAVGCFFGMIFFQIVVDGSSAEKTAKKKKE